MRMEKEARSQLREFCEHAKGLRGAIALAAKENLLDNITLERLKLKISALQQHFHHACDELEEPRQHLIWDADSWW